MFKKSCLAVCMLPVFSTASAGVFVQTGLHFGGDDLATVSYFSGYSESVEAGGLISGSVGYEMDMSESILVKLSAGIKFDAVTAENGDVDFTRYPLTGMIFLKGEDLHLGVGVTQHTGVKLEVDGFFSPGSVDFDDATGLVLQLDYLLNERGYVSLSYTAIDYEPSNVSGIDVNGNSIGVVIGYRFGK